VTIETLFDKPGLFLLLRLADEFSQTATYSKHLGVNFGTNVRITGIVDEGSEPRIMKIGDNVTLTHGVTSLDMTVVWLLPECRLESLVSCVINNFTMYWDFRIMGLPHILEKTHENRTPKTTTCARRRATNPIEGHRRIAQPATWFGAPRPDCSNGRQWQTQQPYC